MPRIWPTASAPDEGVTVHMAIPVGGASGRYDALKELALEYTFIFERPNALPDAFCDEVVQRFEAQTEHHRAGVIGQTGDLQQVLEHLRDRSGQPVRAAVAARAPLFDPEACDSALYQRKLAKRPAARTRFVMHFTPRSGSSWLTDLAEQTGRLGKPGECFNPNFLPRMAARLDAANMDEFVEVMAHPP